jgi:membrane-bound serine protease (ClpP class)
MAGTAAPVVRMATLQADIDPVTAPWVVDQIHAAENNHDAALVLRLDTPGGLETSMKDIYQAELASKVPVIVYVDPAGARAASAGFIVLQASDVAAMNPVSNTGSATPIDSSGQNIGADLRRKVIADAAALARTLAQEHHRNVQAAVNTIVPHGPPGHQVVSNYTASEALRLHVVDDVAPDVRTLLNQIDGRTTSYKHLVLHTRNAVLDEHGLPLTLRVLDVLIDPNLIVLLFLLGIAGIAFELTHPGIVLPGLLGGVALILSLLGLSIVPFSWAGVALLALGVVLLVAEAHVPAHGAFAAVGLLALALGAIVLFRVPGSAGQVSIPLVLSLVIGGGVLVLLVTQRVLQARHRPVATGPAGLAGLLGVAVSPLSPEGQVAVQGERWAARLEPAGGHVARGDPIRVTGVDEGLVLVVEPASEHDPGAAIALAGPAAKSLPTSPTREPQP